MAVATIAHDQNRRGFADQLSPATILRAAIVALILGTVLTLANQWAAVFGTTNLELLPLAQVYLTPFLVVALSQVLGIRQARREIACGQSAIGARENLWRTMMRHDIPRRAVLTGLAAGTANAAIVSVALLIERRALAAFPVGLAAQALILPVLFGLLSQALAYRRVMVTLR